jgi:glycosyltransferase involved in cell wall biosynthesis
VTQPQARRTAATGGPVRTTVVAPVAAPYREPLFAGLNARADLALTVIYADAGQPSWDVPEDFFATAHAYPAEHLRSRQLSRPGRTPVMLPRGLERALSASQPDVVVASEYGPAAIRTRLWAARHGVPYLILTECTPEIDAILPAAQLRWHRAFAQRADGAIAVSSAAARRLVAFDVPRERISVALQSADLDAIRAAAPARDGAPLRVLCVGRLVPDKHVEVLARAVCETALELGPGRVALDIVGDGFLRQRLTETVSELGIDATFHGHRSGAELAALYARADLFALLSGYEPFGVVIREAAAAGLAIITTPVVGAVGDVAIAGANAILVNPGDISETAVAISRVLTDARLRAQMSEQSRAIDAATAGREIDAFALAVLRAQAVST